MNSDAAAFAGNDLDVAGFRAVTDEGVWVRFAVNGDTSPAVGDDLHMSSMDVGVGFDEVCC